MSNAVAEEVVRWMNAVNGLNRLTDAEVLAFHRIVCSRASLIRMRDPEHRDRQRTGYAAARSKMHAAPKREAVSPTIGTAA